MTMKVESMSPSRIIGRLTALLAAAAFSIGATPNWNATVAVTPQGSHVIGNPAAGVKLVEYISYTCPHCADFEKASDAQLRLGFISTGKGSVEYRSYIRSSVDIAASLLAQCGPATNFRGNHSALLRQQATWFHLPSPAEKQRWSNPDFAAAMRAIARDLHLYDLMTARGYQTTVLDRCLADKALADKLMAETETAETVLGVAGTPTFLINGVQQDVNDWSSIRRILTAMTR